MHHRLNASIPLADMHATDASNEFAQVFCSVLKAEPMKGWRGGACSRYLRPSAQAGPKPPVQITNQYRLLLVGGYFSQCIQGPTATFMDSIHHLESAHQVTADIASVTAMGSSEENAKQILDFVNAHFVQDQRPYIALGYSKGAVDLMVALVNYPELRGKIAALVTFAGIVKGSRLAENTGMLGDLIGQLHLPGCDTGDAGGLASMNPATREAFLRDHPQAFVPTYSLVASSDCRQTSTVLRPTWDYLTQFGKTEDSQAIDAEAIAPEAKYLGMARGDHWAIAIPFEVSTDPLLQALVNHNHFPRPQLFESILRYVVADLPRRGPRTSGLQQPQGGRSGVRAAK